MTRIEALVFEFIDRHKRVITAFDEGKLENYIESLCRSYYGCACSNFHLMTSPREIKIGETFDDEFTLSRKEMCELITKFLKTA